MPALSATINPPGTTRAGDTLTLTCTVTVADWAVSSVGTVTLEWMDSEGTTLSTDGNITLGDQMGSSPMFTRTLEFNPLQTSHGGNYTCQARSDTGGITPGTAKVDVTVQSEFMHSGREVVGTSTHIWAEVPMAAYMYTCMHDHSL